MWKQYRRNAPFIQLATLVMALLLYFSGHFLLLQIAAVVIAMEIGGLIGAAWAVRLKRKLGGRSTAKVTSSNL